MTDRETLDALEALVARRVRFVVIGGVAANARGSPSVTYDTDVVYARDEENLERMVQALKGLNAKLRGAPEDVPFKLDAKTLRMGGNFTFTTDAGSLDILAFPAGAEGGYDQLVKSADEMDFGSYKVKVASIDELIKMKERAGRRKDLIEIEVLGALRDEIDARAAEERKKRRKR
ncbi:MAG: hypothetical protein ACRDHM_03630 [Actinomycetota bacterium]